MDKIKLQVEEALKNSKIEKYTNIRYEIKNSNEAEKSELKLLLSQGSISENYTIVEIDFEKITKKSSRKERLNKKMGIVRNEEIFNSGEEYPIIKIYNTPIYIYGEYIKLSRNMTQSPLKIGSNLKTERSVSDFTDDFKRIFQAGSVKFMALGREDLDVRCIQGRPFILEISNPTKNLFITDIEINLYNEIDLVNLCFVKKEAKKVINCESPTKLYNLLIFSGSKINFEDKYILNQKTPLRVLHRRANMIRNKSIDVLKLEEYKDSDGYYYDVDIRTSSGAYVKEWVNGDFGRTIPNLNADLLELDVLKVEQQLDDDFIIKRMNFIRLP